MSSLRLTTSCSACSMLTSRAAFTAMLLLCSANVNVSYRECSHGTVTVVTFKTTRGDVREADDITIWVRRGQSFEPPVASLGQCFLNRWRYPVGMWSFSPTKPDTLINEVNCISCLFFSSKASLGTNNLTQQLSDKRPGSAEPLCAGLFHFRGKPCSLFFIGKGIWLLSSGCRPVSNARLVCKQAAGSPPSSSQCAARPS